eukprot:383980-Rhodomonas_salina.1
MSFSVSRCGNFAAIIIRKALQRGPVVFRKDSDSQPDSSVRLWFPFRRRRSFSTPATRRNPPNHQCST